MTVKARYGKHINTRGQNFMSKRICNRTPESIVSRNVQNNDIMLVVALVFLKVQNDDVSTQFDENTALRKSKLH